MNRFSWSSLVLIAFMACVFACSSSPPERETTSSVAQPLPWVYSSWESVDGSHSDLRRGIATYPTGARYNAGVLMVAVDTDGDLWSRVLDEDGATTLVGHSWSEVPDQTASTTIASTSVPSFVRDEVFDLHAFTVNSSGYVQQVEYKLDLPGDQTGSWESWATVTDLGSGWKSAAVFCDKVQVVFYMLLVRASDDQVFYAYADRIGLYLNDWEGPWQMDAVPSGSDGYQLTGVVWADGVLAFAGNDNGKFYSSEYDPDCLTEGADCWDGWTQMPSISYSSYSTRMLSANWVDDNQVCVYAAHRPRLFPFSDYGEWLVYERCTTDETWESWTSMGTYSTSTNLANEQVPSAYQDQLNSEAESVRYMYEPDAWRGTGKVYSVKRATIDQY